MTFFISLQQICIMFILMAIGFFCRKKGMIHDATSKALTAILVYIVGPCLIINAFERPATKSLVVDFGMTFLAGSINYLFPILCSLLLLKIPKIQKDPDKELIAFGMVYNNCGFIGIPLIQALLGSKGTFFAVPILVLNNIFIWSHGISSFQEREPISDTIRKVLLNPNIIATVIGFVLFLTGASLRFPAVVGKSISYVASLNTPLSMIVIGSNLGAIKGDFYKDQKAWLICFLRNYLMPTCLAFILLLFPLSNTAYLAVVIMAAAPVAGFIVMLSLLANRPVAFPMRALCLSTLMSVVSVPLIVMLASLLKGI